MAATKAVELIVSGEVQGVGYRGFVIRIARKLKLVGFVENLEDGTVRIWCKGEAASVDKFKELINVKNPVQASLIEVESIAEKALKFEDITTAGFKEKLGELGEEMAQGFATGNAYLSSGFTRLETTLGKKIDDLSSETKFFRAETNANFGVLSDKYGKISNTIERIDKNIEKMANKKTGIF